MRTSRSCRPVAGTFAAALAVSATLLIDGVSDAAQPAATPVVTVPTLVTVTGTPVTVTHGTASTTTSTLTAGTHQLTAVFTRTDPATFSPSTSPAVPLSVPGSGEGGSLQTITPQAQQSGQSLDELPVLDAEVTATPVNLPEGPLGIPSIMLDAYQRAERTMAETQPACRLSWSVLAGIGKIESGHASGGQVDAAGNTLGSIRGARLNGSSGTTAISDTDQGALDGDAVWDRAVGPMQFTPSSWRSYGVAANGNGAANPDNIYDSTLAAGRYLCAGGGDLSDPAQQRAAVFRYNHSASYVRTVQRWAQAYQTGVFPTPSAPESVPLSTNTDGDLQTVVTFSRQTAVAPPVVAQLDPPTVAQPAPTAVAQLDQPAVAQLDAQPATSAATTSSPPPSSLD